MALLTSKRARISTLMAFFILAWMAALSPSLKAQDNPSKPPLDLGTTNADSGDNALPSLNTLTNSATTLSAPAPTPVTAVPTAAAAVDLAKLSQPDSSAWSILAALLTLGSIGGFLLYQVGLTRAKNCGHTSTLLLIGVAFGLIGYWMGGFAVQTGGVGDTHAALPTTISTAGRNELDHEIGFIAGGHHWGLMGSAGFFLTSDVTVANGMALLFLGQAVLLAVAVAAALGAGLERAKIIGMAIVALVMGALIYPLLANWVWGGGWLAELGREYGLGHGFVDLGGAGVVHETAGTLALVLALVLGPRYGRFDREKISRSIPGHNLPLVVLGAVILLVSWTATNAFAAGQSSALAAVNTVLAAVGGLVVTYLTGAWQKLRPSPSRLARGLLGGAVASCGGAALFNPWAAFVVGGLAAIFVQVAFTFLENRRVDDPVGAAATHGVGGAWGVVATGLFANGAGGLGYNGIDNGVRGLFFGGNWYQLAAQGIGAATGFVVVFILGYAFLILIHKIVGLRVELIDEVEGLDWPEIGALGYQGDGGVDEN